MALAVLSVDLVAKLANFEAGMDKAARLAEKNAAATEAAWKRAGAGLAGIGAAIGGAFAGFSLVQFVTSNVDALDALNDVADATGASIENISALENVAKRTGTTMDTVTTALIKFNGQLAEATPGSAIEKVLSAIGLKAAELRQQDPAEALRLVAVALSSYADDGNKARLVQELFGKSTREVAPLLKDLAEQTKLVGTTTTEQAAAAEKFNKQLAELRTNVDLTRRAFVLDLLPALTKVLNELRTGIEVFGGFKEALLGIGLSNPFENIADRVDKLAKLREELEKVNAAADGDKTRTEKLATEQRRKSLESEIASLSKLVDYYKRVQVLNAPAADYSNEGRLPAEVKPSVGDVDKGGAKGGRDVEKISAAQRALAAYVGELQKELDKVTELSAQQKMLNLLRAAGADKNPVGPGMREYVEIMQMRVTLAKQDNAIREDNLRIIKEQEAAQKSLNDEIYKLSGRADDARKAALTKTLEDQLNSGTEYSAAELEKIVKGIAGISEQAEKTFGELDELTKEFGRNVQDALGDTILSTLKGDFDNILSLWGNLLLKMASQALAADLGKTLFGNLFGSKGEGAGQLGGAFGDLIQFIGNKMPFTLARGGVVEGPTITQFAAGGVFDRATRFSYGGGASIGELGEAGPEAIMPLRRGRDGKLGVAAAGAAGPTIVFQIASGVTRPELQAMVPALTEQIKAEVRASMRRPGGGY